MSRSRHPHERGTPLASKRWHARNILYKKTPLRDERRAYDVDAGLAEYEDHTDARGRADYSSPRAIARMTPFRPERVVDHAVEAPRGVSVNAPMRRPELDGWSFKVLKGVKAVRMVSISFTVNLSF